MYSTCIGENGFGHKTRMSFLNVVFRYFSMKMGVVIFSEKFNSFIFVVYAVICWKARKVTMKICGVCVRSCYLNVAMSVAEDTACCLYTESSRSPRARSISARCVRHVIELLNVTECNILPQKPLRQYKNFKPHLLGSGFLSVVDFCPSRCRIPFRNPQNLMLPECLTRQI